MQLTKKISNIDDLWDFEESIIFYSETTLKNLEQKSINFEFNTCFYSNKYIYHTEIDCINIYDASLTQIKKIQIKDPVAIIFVDGLTDYIVRSGKDQSLYSIFLDDKLVKEETDIIGSFLTREYRVNFLDKFSPIKYTRCSDWLDEITYWEYNFDTNFNCESMFYVWKDNVFFVVTNGKVYWLVMKDLKTGQEKWRTEIPGWASSFNYDKERGKLGALVAMTTPDYQSRLFSIFDLESGTFESFDFETPYLLDKVHLGYQLQYLKDNKLYFIDNPFSSSRIGKPNYPKFGCFDINTKTVDFVQEVTEAEGLQLGRIVYNDKKIYFRDGNSNLYVFE